MYGPERVARLNIKADKLNGGINGVDVESFIKSIMIKQAIKSLTHNRILRSLQLSYIAPRDKLWQGVVEICNLHYRTSFRDSDTIYDLDEIERVSAIAPILLLKRGSKSFQYARDLRIYSLFSLQSSLHLNLGPRTKINCIIRALPKSISSLIRCNMLMDNDPQFIWMLKGQLKILDKRSAKLLYNSMKNVKLNYHTLNLAKIYKSPNWDLLLPSQDVHGDSQWYSNIWNIKHPGLRAFRVKLLFKDVFSNERRFRFGMSDSALCEHCGIVESVEHQLLECSNASRLWQLFRLLSGESTTSIREVLHCSMNMTNEIIKSVIIKRLLQIDRSRDVPIRSIAIECLFHFRIKSAPLPMTLFD